jgi:hypothetical protein
MRTLYWTAALLIGLAGALVVPPKAHAQGAYYYVPGYTQSYTYYTPYGTQTNYYSQSEQIVPFGYRPPILMNRPAQNLFWMNANYTNRWMNTPPYGRGFYRGPYGY